MDQKLQNLEEIFRNTMEKGVEVPSVKVLRKLKFRLGVSDFLSLNPRKFNILYTTVALGGLATLFVLNIPTDNIEETENEVVVSELKSEPIPERVIKAPENVKVAENLTETHKSERVMLAAMFDLESTSGCAPFEVSFTNKSLIAETNIWDFGNGEKSSAKNPTVIYSEPGLYQATLTIKDKNGAIASHKRAIEVLAAPTAAFDINIDESDVGSREVIFDNQSSEAADYTWDFGDEHLANTPEAIHSYEDYGVYHVKLIAKAKNGCSDTAHLTNRFIEKDYSLAFPLNFRPNPYNRGEDGFYESASSHAAIFYPKNRGVKEYKLTITAANGLEIFSTNNIKQGWNGYLGGRLAPVGIYTYEAVGVYPNGQSFSYIGKLKVLIEDFY